MYDTDAKQGGFTEHSTWLFSDSCVTVSFVMSVRPHGTNRLSLDGFSLNVMFEIFRKYFDKIRVSLKSDNNWYFTGRPIYIFDNIF